MIDLNNILNYGRDYGEGGQPFWWFNLADEQVVDEKWLRSFGYDTPERIAECSFVIPLFRTDIIAEEREFLRRQPRSPLIRQLLAMPEDGLDKAFRAYVERAHLMHEWRVWEQRALRRDGEIWCRENNIQYR